MKWLLILFVAGTLALKADDTPAANPASTIPSAPPPIDDATVTHQGYPASRYESLWTKSPFAVETPEDVAESPDYSLVGIAETDGVSYASLVDTKSQEHFLISSDKPTNGLTLGAVTRKEGGDTYADVIRDGQHLTLKLEQVTMTAGGPPGTAPAINMPGSVTPQIPMPNGGNNVGGMPGSTPSVRPLIRIHRPVIHVPARPANQNVAPPPPAPSP